jgi:hypothetical protein
MLGATDTKYCQVRTENIFLATGAKFYQLQTKYIANHRRKTFLAMGTKYIFSYRHKFSTDTETKYVLYVDTKCTVVGTILPVADAKYFAICSHKSDKMNC